MRATGLSVRLHQIRPIPLDAELHCAQGELLALVGPSGSGKTTILHAIAGLFRPHRGEITCDGETWLNTADALDVSPQHRRVGMVFQSYALFPHMSALDNVIAALGHLPRHERAERAYVLLELVHLAGLERRRPSQLSGGQKQRVALARALAREPRVLLLDEPFSAVDQVTRRRLQRELVLLRNRISIPTVLVTHDLNEAAALADRMCALSRGRTLQDGPPAEVIARPVSVLVAELMDIGNIFEGIVIEHRTAPHVTALRWLDYVLEARHTETFSPGSKVAWVIPPSHVIMHRRGRPSRGERENPVRGRVSEMVRLGENTTVKMRVNGSDRLLTFSVSTHAAVRNALAPGEALSVSLLTEGIHLMPWEPPGSAAR